MPNAGRSLKEASAETLKAPGLDYDMVGEILNQGRRSFFFKFFGFFFGEALC